MHAEASMPSPWPGTLAAEDVQRQILPMVAADLMMQQFSPVCQPTGPVKRPAHSVLQAAFKKPSKDRIASKNKIRKQITANNHAMTSIAIADGLPVAKAAAVHVKNERGGAQTDKKASDHAAALLELAHIAAQEIEARQKTSQPGDQTKPDHHGLANNASTWTLCPDLGNGAPSTIQLHLAQPPKTSLPSSISNLCFPLPGMVGTAPSIALEALQVPSQLPGFTSSVPGLTLTPSPSCPNNLGTDITMSGPFRSGRSSAAPALTTTCTTASLAGLAVMQSQLKVMHDWYVINKDAYLTEATVHLHLLQESNKPVAGQQSAGMAAVCRAMEKALEIMHNTAAQAGSAWMQPAAMSPHDPNSSPDTLRGSASAQTPVITSPHPVPGTLLVTPTDIEPPCVPFISLPSTIPVACGIPTATV